MILLMLIPSIALAAVAAWAFWWTPRRLRRHQETTAEPYIRACSKTFAWYRQEHQARKR